MRYCIAVFIAWFCFVGIVGQVDDKNTPEYATKLINWAKERIEAEQFAGIEDSLKQAIAIREALFGEKSPEYAEPLTLLGLVYVIHDDRLSAIDLIYKALVIRKNTVKEDSPEFAHSLLALGYFHLHGGETNEAEEYYTRAKNIYEKTVEKTDWDYLSVIAGLAVTYFHVGKLQDAIDLLRQTMSIVEEKFDKDHPFTITAYSNLGSAYQMLNENEKAEYYLLKSMEFTQKKFGKQHSYYFNAANSLGRLYQKSGLYEKAEALWLESLQLRKAQYGEKHQSVGRVLSGLGTLYLDMRNYKEAEKYFFESLEMSYKNPIHFAMGLSNLSLIFSEYYNQKEYALELAQDAALIFKENNAESHPYFITLMSNIVAYLSELESQDYEHVVNLYLESLQKQEMLAGKNSQLYLTTKSNLAAFYHKHSRLEQAKDLYEEIIKICENHPDIHLKLYYINLGGLGLLHLQSENIKEAQSSFELAFDAIKNEVQQNFVFFSERERELFWSSIEELLQKVFKDFVYTYMNESELSAAEFAYNIELLTKSILLSASQHVHTSIVNSGDETLADLWNNLHSLKNLYIQAELQPTVDSAEMEEIRQSIQQLEREMARRSRPYRDLQNTFELNWQDVQQALNENEAAIEFTHIPTSETEANYYALLLRSGYERPLIIELCLESDIIKVMQTDFSSQSEYFYTLLWEDLESYLEGVSNIFIAPAGLLHTVSFEGIKNKDYYLCDKYTIHRLLSTKDIIDRQTNIQNNKIKKAVLFGGADFGLSPNELNTASPIRGQGFDYLPGSTKEVLAIEKQLAEFNWETALFIDKDATKTHFKSFSSMESPELLHISTHGFYFLSPADQEVLQKNIYQNANNPLLRSGLAFSGANYVWSGKEPINDMDDGILTAYEVSNMNLSNTELVVLSACKTGLGDYGSEGIYGLQRAFRLAGVQSMIVSLWEVPDRETMELMTEFYSQWTTTNNIKTAFSVAQQKLREKYPNDPQKWAGFVVIE
jgi:CHAT domain-containing protein